MKLREIRTIEDNKIPRLELLSASLGLKLAKKIIDVYEINMEKVTFWCDSRNILWWIRGMSRKFKPYVANRVGETESLTQPAQWRYVPSKENPTDLVNRGLSIDQLNNSSKWLSGPDFLKELSENCPKLKFETPTNEAMEIKKIARTHTANHVVPARLSRWSLDPKRYSSWPKLIRVTAWVKRFLYNSQSLKEH